MTTCFCGNPARRKYCSNACKQEAYRNRKCQQRNRRLREQRSKLYIVPCNLDTANAFVSRLHRHNKAVPGAKFCLGVVDETGLLRGVAIVGRPVARMLDGFTLEVNRVCTDGVPNGCSALYGAARKVAFTLGYGKVVTYTLADESGSSMRGAGWRKVQETKASDNWQRSRPNRASQGVYSIHKWRWETINPEWKRDRPRQIMLPEAMNEASPVPSLWDAKQEVQG